ncbi:hypothetical protein ACFPYJ_18570 [Paenibacillus solisilvae]|uniref:Uncharacterized protein n=1 Tax=Paenibacillus solisilvae TaxID=2486751 RepID=A0ABW0VYS2_9BACL
MGKWCKWYPTRVLTLFLALIMVVTFIPAGGVFGAGTLLKTGNYYYSLAPNGGSLPDKGMTGLVSSTNGVLLDGLTTTYAGWTGSATSPGTVQVVFDLLKDYPLESINVVLNSPNSFWGFKEFTVKYRPEAVTDYYYIAAKHIRTPGITSTSPSSTWNYSVNIPMSNKTARFIVIDIKRPHAFQHIPLTEVQIYKGTGQEGVNPGPALTAEQMALELKKDGLMADKYGQWVYETWPGKVTSDEQLQQEYMNEADALSNVSLDLTKYDPYGGIKNGGQYANTGYFRLQQIDNKWWFITPDGYKFILKGVDATSIWEWGYGTPLNKADGITPRQVFEELPDPVAYAPAYVNDANGERVSFVVANVMKKYGSNYESKWEDITKKRLIDWGFNAFSKWTRPQNVTFPYIQVLQDPSSLRRIQWTYDVFDPQSESIIENALINQLQNAKNDPWLIGYTYDNEAGWTTDIVKEVLTYTSTSPAKSAFVDFLAPRYNNDIAAVNQLLGTSSVSFAELKNTSINISKVPSVDVSDYIKLASRTYFSTIKNIIKRNDTNHLFLGSSVVPTWRTSLDWDSAAMEFVDAFSVDNYTNNADWINRYEAFGKPLLNLEYTFSTTERGLSPVNAATSVASIADRGLAFKSFVESQTSHPLFIGSGYFSYYDQAVTWRKDGENFNIGLLNQQDQPYTDMVNIMKTVNAGLENVHSNEINLELDPSAPNGLNGWYTVPVTVTLSAAYGNVQYSLDGGSSWSAYDAPVTLGREGSNQMLYRPVTVTGSVYPKSVEAKIDLTAPLVHIIGEPSYTIDQTVNIICNAVDTVSSVTYSSCGAPLTDVKAYTLEPGVHSVTAEAEDAAGHRGSAEHSYSVYATFDSLSALTGTFAAETGAAGAVKIAASLQQQLETAEARAAERKGAEARKLLQAYINDVNKQSGKVFTAEQAAVLVRWAHWLHDVTPLAGGAPGKPLLSDNNGYDTGLKDGSYTITKNLWWGNNGTEFKLYENGVLINTQTLTDNSPQAQIVKTDIAGKVNGTYTYSCELTNTFGSTACDPLVVTVTDAAPGKPVLSHNNWDGSGNYYVSMNMWWGTNGSEFRLYENGKLIDTKPLSEGTPNAQKTVTNISGKAPGVYEYRGVLVNAAGETSSETITVTVKLED